MTQTPTFSMHLALLRPASLPLRPLLSPLRRNAAPPPPSVVLAPRCGDAKKARGRKRSNSRRIDISAVIRPKDVRAIARAASSLAANLLLLALDGGSGAGGLGRGLLSDATWGGGGWWKRPRRWHGIRGLAWLAAAAAAASAAALGRESGGARIWGSAVAGLRGLVARKGSVGVAVALGLLFCVAVAWSGGRRGRRRRSFLKWKGWR